MTTSSTTEVHVTEVASAAATESASQLGRWLEEYGEIAAILPVMAGLLVTNRLQLRGANALLVNIAIAAIARQAIVQLKKQSSHTSPVAVSKAAAEAPTVTAANEDYTIVHSVPGRIRLKILRLQSDSSYAKRLEKLLLAEDNVLSVRINRSASSLVIRYDNADMTELALGMRLLNLLERAEQADIES